MSAKHRTRSRIDTELPDNIKKDVNQLLVSGATYDGIADFLQKRGYDISKSSVGRYGKQFAEAYQKVMRFSAQAQTLTSEGIGGLTLDEAATKLLMQQVLEKLIDGKVDIEDMPRLMSDVARLQSSNVSREKFKAEIAAKAKLELMATQKQQLDKAVKSGGLDPLVAQKARQILGFE